jgi:anti-anti-sigma factor
MGGTDLFDISVGADGVLWLSGEFDLAAVETFMRVACDSIDGQHEVVLDLSNVRFLDSAGIRAITTFSNVCKGGLVLRSPSDNIRRVIDLVGIDGRNGIRVERDEAPAS